MRLGDPRVVLVDDEPRLRTQLAAVLADYDVVIVGEAGTGREGVELACRLQPDVVLMDLRMPELDGIAATRQLSQLLPSTAVIMLSAYEDPALMKNAAADRTGPPPKGATPASRIAAEHPHG